MCTSFCLSVRHWTFASVMNNPAATPVYGFHVKMMTPFSFFVFDTHSRVELVGDLVTCIKLFDSQAAPFTSFQQ